MELEPTCDDVERQVGGPRHVSAYDGISQITGSYDHLVALKADGTVWTGGKQSSLALGFADGGDIPGLKQVPGISNAISVASGPNSVMVLRRDGTVVSWGGNDYGQLDRLPGFAAELVSKGVDIIVTYGGPPTYAARNATKTIPIVFALVADPVAIGAAATLDRPGGNLTGVTNNDPELPVRHMALLKEMIPKLARVAIFSDADIPGADASGLAPIDRTNAAAARAAGLTPQVLKLRGSKPDFDAAFKAMASEGAEALVVLEVPAVFAIPKTVAELATARRIPTMLWGGQGEAGGLMSYGTSYTSTFPRVPVYVDRILKGAKPSDTPIEVFSKHQLVINLKTARELGLTIPAELLKRADRVIE